MTRKLILVLALVIIPILGLMGAGIYYIASDSSQQQELSSADCTSVELYDAETGECYYECDTDEQCAQIEAQIDAELNKVFENTTTKIGPGVTKESSQDQPIPAETADTTEPADSLEGSATYAYTNGSFTPSIQDQDQLKYATIFVSIATKQFADSYLSQVTFFNDSSNDTAASVVQNADNQTKWDLEINMAYASDESEMLMTLVHEYAHIFSLNSGQVDGTVTGSCPALQIAEGCSKQGSFINSFQSQFWVGLSADAENEEFGAYYSGKEGDFVSEYAATNVVEDFADTFAYTTLKDTSAYTGVALQKVTWMKQDGAIAARMKEIKTTLAGNLRARKIIK